MTTRDCVASHLNTLGWDYHLSGDQYVDVPYMGRHATVIVHFLCGDDYVSLNILLGEVPESRMAETALLANRLNAQHGYGGVFVIHPESRRLRFTMDHYTPDEPSLDQIRFSMEYVWVLDESVPAFARVLWSGWDAAAALTVPLEPPQGDTLILDGEGEDVEDADFDLTA